MNRPRRTVLSVIAASLVGLGLVTGVGVVVVYDNWNGNLDREDVVVKNTPPKENDALNILVMGDDTRDGPGNGLDDEQGGGGSDTTILFHLSADRTFAYGISIPRDTAVRRPTCYRADGSEIAGSTGYVKWNDAYATGGPGCTQQQFQELTGVPVDNYIVVDFNQFKDMVDALDGVEICLPKAIDDPRRNVHLAAGTREVNGEEALQYARVRYGISDGVDPYRTRRQQALIGAMIDKALGRDMLARLDRVIGFVNAASSSLTTDFASLAAIAKVAFSARGIGADNIRFVTTPWVLDDSLVSGGVAWTEATTRLWRLVRKDLPLTPEFLDQSLSAGDRRGGPSPRTPSGAPSTSASASPGASPGASADAGPAGTPSGTPTEGGMSAEDRDRAGLCS